MNERNRSKVILITGASSGIGWATAALLASNGHRVFGASRHAPVEALPGVEMLRLDVRDDASVTACVEAVLDRAGRLDVLVNNAGYELHGAIEETSREEARGQFETNFFGATRMVQAVLPLMRRQGGGRIINITSLLGLTAAPFLGFYSASKFALEGYSEALRHEVRPFGIYVSTIEAGFLKTGLVEHGQATGAQVSAYDPWRHRASLAMSREVAGAPGPELIARAILDVIESGSPRLRYRLGSQARRVSLLRRFLPEPWFEAGVRRSFHLDDARIDAEATGQPATQP